MDRSVRRASVIALLLACLIALSPARSPAADHAHVLVLADTPPFSYRLDGRLKGFNIDMAEELCRRAGLTCQLGEATLGTILEEVAGGRAEIGMGNMLKTHEREKRVLFSAPLWRSTSSFVGQRGAHVAKDTARLAVVAGSVQAEYLYRTYPGATIQETLSTAASLKLVEDGAADYTLLPIAVASEIVRRSSRLAFTGETVRDPKLGGTVHAIFPKTRADMKDRVDGALAQMLADGTYFRISRRYFPFDLH